MKLKVIDLYDMAQGLNNILDKELPIKVAFSLQKNLKKIEDEAKPADDLKKKVNEKYKEHITDDGRIPDAKKRKSYIKELEEINEQEVELKGLTAITLSDLGECIKPRTLYLIEPMIKEDEE